MQFGAPATHAVDERWQSKEGKMEKSFLNFKAAHPDWTPADPSGSLYLSRIADFAAHPVGLGRRRFLRGGGGVVPGLSAGDMDSTVHLHHPAGAGAGAGGARARRRWRVRWVSHPGLLLHPFPHAARPSRSRRH